MVIGLRFFFAATNGNETVVRLLLETGGVSLVFPDRFGDNPLHAAVRARDADIVRQLLEAGAAVNQEDGANLLPIHYAASHGSAEITGILLEAGAPADMSALLTATQLGHVDVASLLIEAGASVVDQDQNGQTLLHFAARAGHLEVVELLLAAGAPVGVRTKSGGDPPIHDAVLRGLDADSQEKRGFGTEIDSARYLEVAMLLIQAGEPLDFRLSNFHETLLHRAAMQNAPRFVKVLLEGGAEPDLKNFLGETPLHIAARSARDSSGVEVVRLLLEAGASVDTKDKQGRTALDQAEGNLEAWRLIKDWDGS